MYVFLPHPNWWQTEIERHIVVHIKLPVLITALLVGASISVSSATLQVLLRNPLADPGLIGISSGASLTAAVLILTGSLTGLSSAVMDVDFSQQYVLSFACFLGALLSSILIIKLAKRMISAQSGIILMGIAISTISGAIIGWLYLFAPPHAIKSMTFWLMGSLHNTDYPLLMVTVPWLMLGLGFIIINGASLNRLYLDANTAKLSGLDPIKLERALIIACAVLVGVSVSIAGSIAFVGLLVPHFIRALFGHENKQVLWLSAILGGVVMVITAIINELVFTNLVPVSMLTASVGGPLFIYALLRQQRR